jgi:hypothetical protein
MTLGQTFFELRATQNENGKTDKGKSKCPPPPLKWGHKNPHAKHQEYSFTVMLIIIHVKLVYSDSSTQGTLNTQHICKTIRKIKILLSQGP